jgi:hypothetical protein
MAAPSYPAPRLERTGAGGAGGGGAARGASIPSVRHWPFELSANNGTCSVAVSSRFSGMAVVELVEWFASNGLGGSASRLDVLVATDSGGAREGAVDTARPSGRSLFEAATFADAGDGDQGGNHQLALTGTLAATTPRRGFGRVAVTENDFVLKVYLLSEVGLTFTAYGLLRVVEGLFEDELANFL